MPNVKKKKNKSTCATSDFTIKDFADANKPNFRPKKQNTMLQEATNWDDNVDDDIELVEVENEDGTTVLVAHRKITISGSFNYNYDENIKSDGVEYPLDIWFQISNYIAPEDIGRFAGICQASLSVTHSAKFWFHMYKRYYKKTSNSPERLQPSQMTMRYGLRTCVIRSLFFNYTPFVNMVKQNHNFYTPKILLKRKCASMWYTKPKDFWIFYFKLKLIDQPIYRTKESCKKNVFDILDNVMDNTEENCKVLKVQCQNFPPIPPVMGMILNELFTKVAPNMRHSRLSLGFSLGQQIHKKAQDCIIILNNVIKMEVLDWWHPDYPHSKELLPSSIISNCDNSSAHFSTDL